MALQTGAEGAIPPAYSTALTTRTFSSYARNDVPPLKLHHHQRHLLAVLPKRRPFLLPRAHPFLAVFAIVGA